MNDPLFLLLAPFGLAFGLWALFLVVSVLRGEPDRPFRMFASPKRGPGKESAGEHKEKG